MLNSISQQIGLLALALTCLFAWIKGGAAERAGASAVAVAWISSIAVQALSPPSAISVVMLPFDVLLAAALLVIAIRYSSLWLGVAMMLQALVMALHAEQLGDGMLNLLSYIIIQNLASYAMLVALMVSTVLAWLGRMRDRREIAAPPPPPSIANPA